MRNRIWTAAFASALLVSQACYHTRVLTDTPPASAMYESKTVNNFFWGLLQQNVEVGRQNCPSNALQEVRVTTNFGYALVTIVTLGIWSPLEVQYKCAKPAAPPPPHFGAALNARPQPVGTLTLHPVKDIGITTAPELAQH